MGGVPPTEAAGAARVRSTAHGLPKPNRRMAARRAKTEAGRAATGHRLTGRRAMAMLIVLSLGLSAVILRLTQVQAVSAAQYEKLGANQRIRKITHPRRTIALPLLIVSAAQSIVTFGRAS